MIVNLDYARMMTENLDRLVIRFESFILDSKGFSCYGLERAGSILKLIM